MYTHSYFRALGRKPISSSCFPSYLLWTLFSSFDPVGHGHRETLSSLPPLSAHHRFGSFHFYIDHASVPKYLAYITTVIVCISLTPEARFESLVTGTTPVLLLRNLLIARQTSARCSVPGASN